MTSNNSVNDRFGTFPTRGDETETSRKSSYFSNRTSSSGTASTILSPCLDNTSKRISYITDLEGDVEYFNRYIEVSQVLKFEPVAPNFDETKPLDFFPYTKHVVFIENSGTNNDVDETMLVCGGDIWDKGGGDLYVIRQLLSMQNRYGDDRVHFIVGNRDINKMRILQEIGMCDYNLPNHYGLFWLKGTGLTGDPDMIDALEYRTTSKSICIQNNGRVSSCAVERLRWMLQDTMGCPDGIELRRGELEREKLACARAKLERTTDDSKIDCTVTDEEVVQSYRNSCHPNLGVMGQYIRKGKIAMKIGGVLFVHGSIPFSSTILMKYKAYSKQMDDVSSMCMPRTKRKHEMKDIFWENFFEYMMPWLKSSTETELLRKSATDSGATTSSEISRSYSWPQPGQAKIHSTKISNDNAVSPKLASVCRSIFCCRLSKHSSKNYNKKRKRGTMLNTGSSKSTDGCEPFIENLVDNGETPVRNIDEWVDTINAFISQNSEAWAKYVTDKPSDYCWSRYGGYSSKIGALMQYGFGSIPNKGINPTVIYSTWITNGMPQIFSGKSEEDLLRAKLLGEFFIESGLELIVSGHQPIGDSPLTIQVANEDSNKPRFIIIGDTSYSGDTIWEGRDGKRQNMGRGKAKSGRGDVAVSEILIDISAQGNMTSTTYHGRLSDGRNYESCNIVDNHQDSSIVGKLLDKKELIIEGVEDDDQTDWIVKARLSDDGSYLVSSGKGHKVFNAIATKRRL